MTRSTLGQSLDSALAAWRKLATNGSTGPGVDFGDTNRTRLCQERLDAFLETPSVETFRALWSAESLAGYWAPSAAVLLGPDDAVETLQSVLSELNSAAEYDPTWTDRLNASGANWSLMELFARSRGGHEPIPTIEAKAVLPELGYSHNDDPESVAEAIERFAETYESTVGHATEGRPYELPIYAEIDEFFRLVETTDRETVSAQVTGPYAPLFRPLIGYRHRSDSAEELRWSGVEGLIDQHIEARDSAAYDDLETVHWGGKHIESWKWQFKEYFEEVVRAEFDLTNLSAEDVTAFFDAIENPDAEFDAVSNVPAKMMGGQFHRLTWGDIVDHCHENPTEAATVLSDLYDEELPIVDRLNTFYEFFRHLTTREENDRSPGSLLRAATALLMYAYPQRHITFQYRRMDHFFEQYSTSDGLDTGYNARQYKEVALACRALLEKVEERSGQASMIDVQTLIYVADDA